MQKNLWVLTDNRRGSVGQAMGVINELDKKIFTVTDIKLDYTRFAALPNWLRAKTLLGITKQSKTEIKAPYPDYVLSISRRTVPVARYIKKMSPKTKLIQLMHPGTTGLKEFSLVIVPEHDKDKAFCSNIHYIVGCPHRITQDVLSEARRKWQNTFADLPRPLTAVIVGGAIKKKPFSLENAHSLGDALKKLKSEIGGSVLITTSRRTGENAQKIIMEKIKNIPQHNFLWGDKSDNPYLGYLACADNIVVTGDSVSMCCEATGTGKPIYIFTGKNWLTPKHLRFVNSLCATKCAVLLENPEAAKFVPSASINSALEIADLIAKL